MTVIYFFWFMQFSFSACLSYLIHSIFTFLFCLHIGVLPSLPSLQPTKPETLSVIKKLFCVLMSVQQKTEREQTILSTPSAYYKHTHCSTWNREGKPDGVRGQSRKQTLKRWKKRVQFHFLMYCWETAFLLVYNVRISDLSLVLNTMLAMPALLSNNPNSFLVAYIGW